MPVSSAGRERLVREKAKAEEDHEERHGRLGDRGDAGVDVLLAPGDEPERDRRSRSTPSTAHWRHERRSSATARRFAHRRDEIRRAATTAAIAARAHMSGAGSRPPSTATLMKRYDAPQRAARSERAAASSDSRLAHGRPRDAQRSRRDGRAREDERQAGERRGASPARPAGPRRSRARRQGRGR